MKFFLSIIIPAYNEEKRLPTTLKSVVDFLCKQSYTSELIIVENGSTDQTFKVAQNFVEKHDVSSTSGQPHLRLIKESNRGKGLAIKRGMLESKGAYRFMCDADLSMPISRVNHFIPPKLSGFDIAIGSREALGSQRYNEPFYRHWGGRAVNAMIRTFALPGLHDTQCGFKCFPASTAERLFTQQTITGWSFDIEVLFIARKQNLKIIEVPIPWYFSEESKLNVVSDTIQMGLDILKIHRNALLNKYK